MLEKFFFRSPFPPALPFVLVAFSGSSYSSLEIAERRTRGFCPFFTLLATLPGGLLRFHKFAVVFPPLVPFSKSLAFRYRTRSQIPPGSFS